MGDYSENTNKGELFMKIERLTVERDAALAKSAELASRIVKAESLRDKEEARLDLITDIVNSVLSSNTKTVAIEAMTSIGDILDADRSRCLLEVKAEVAEKYYYMGWEHSLSTKADDGDHYGCGKRLAKSFADSIRQEGD